MMAQTDEDGRLKAFAAASQTVNQWYLGAQALTLLRAAERVGLIRPLREPCTAAHLTNLTGFDTERVADLCAALYAVGVVDEVDGGFQLSPPFLELTAPDAPQHLANTLGTQALRLRALEGCGAAHTSLECVPPDDLLTMSLGIWGLPTSSAALDSFASVDAAMPEVRTLWERGARHLELGCGAGRDLLHIATLYPKVTVVGVDISAESLDEVRRQAAGLGIADRVELRHQDARHVTDQAQYDTAVWSQMYFPPQMRAETARVVRQALKPGGYLLLPLQAEPPATIDGLRTPAGQQVALSRVTIRAWGLRWYCAEEIRAELEQAGFTFVRVVPHPRTDYMLMRAPET